MKKLLSHLYRADSLLAALLFMVIFVVIVAEILSRALLHHSLLWTNDFCCLTVAWMLAFGMSAAFYKREHLRIDFIRDKLPGSAVRVIDVAMCLLCTAFLVMLIPYGIKTTGTKMKILYTTLRWPMGYAFAALPVFAAISTIFSLNNLVSAVKHLRKKGTGADAAES